MSVLPATGNGVSRDFAFGLVLQLLRTLGGDDNDEERRRLVAGPAAPASSLLDQIPAGDAETEEAQHVLIHGVAWIVRNHIAAAGRPVAVIVDDAHWTDAASLRFLAHLAVQAPALPLAIILAGHTGTPVSDPLAAAALRRSAGAPALTLPALGQNAVAALVGERLPEAAPEVTAALATLTAGNPLLVTAMLDEAVARGLTGFAHDAAALPELLPPSVALSVRERLDAVGDLARRVATVVAVLGDEASTSRVASVTGLDARTVLDAADALSRHHLLAPGGAMRFAQPLLANVVLGELSPFVRARAHLDAARVLREQNADADDIVRHLLLAPATDDAEAVAPLREAASRALQRGDAERAVALLHRALQEQPGLEARVDLLTELGRAESDAGYPGATSRLDEARQISTDPGRRADLALAQSRALYATGRYRESAEVLRDSQGELGETDPRLDSELSAAFISSASIVDDLAPQVLERRAQFLSALSSPPPPFERAAVAHMVIRDAFQGTARVEIRRLALLAWGEGALLRAGDALGLGPPMLCIALVIADELELAIEIADETLAERGHPAPVDINETVSGIRAWAHLEQGKLGQAEAEATAVLDGPAGMLPRIAQAMLALIACCHNESGRPEQAELILERLARSGMGEPMSQGIYLHIRALSKLVEHRPQEALADAVRAGELIEGRFPGCSPGMVPWRSTAAEAYLALGQRDQSRALAHKELVRSRALGVTRAEIRNLRILGLSDPSDGLPDLADAVRLGESYPRRLEHARALVDFGAELRRRNRRGDAREPLRRGLDLAHKGGANRLVALARSELTATGARPRRPDATGVNSLTVSQRRVAELASRGLTTRQMAEALFVTPKTVEFHLRHVYQKLDVASRDALRELMTRAHAAGDTA